MLYCPYCSKPITPAPKRGRDCPHCGEKFLVRAGELYTWAGAQEYDRKKRYRYPVEVRFCPNCGELLEQYDFIFTKINPCPKCKHYIDWPSNTVVPWEKVNFFQPWYDPMYPPPGQKPATSCCIEISEDSVGYYDPEKEPPDPADWWKKDTAKE